MLSITIIALSYLKNIKNFFERSLNFMELKDLFMNFKITFHEQLQLTRTSHIRQHFDDTIIFKISSFQFPTSSIKVNFLIVDLRV